MTLWIVFAVMTAAAVFAVLWPLGRKPGDRGAGSDRLVYQDQLKEIDRDRAVGLIGDVEAESARIEISRRLLAAVDAESAIAERSSPKARRRRAAGSAILIVPLVALALYLKLGSPALSAPHAFAPVSASA